MSRRACIGLSLISMLFIVRYAWVVDIHWINDDFIFLDHVRDRGFVDLWGQDDALGNAYRPIPRNLYFWLGRRLFGTDPTGFHVVNLAVAIAGLWLLYGVLARMLGEAATRITARRRLTSDAADAAAPGGAPPTETPVNRQAEGAALLATLLFAAHPAAGTPIAWTCGVQDLLAVTLTAGAMLAHLAGRRVIYLVCFVAAVLSKETTVFVPFLLALHDLTIRREKWRSVAMNHAAPLAAVVVWLAGNRWLPWHDLGATIHSEAPGQRTLLGRFDPGTVWLTLRSLVLLEPYEAFAWPYGTAATAAMIVLSLLALGCVARLAWPPRTRPALFGLAILWSLSGILPLITVISRFVYYAYYPAIGLALAIVVALILIGGRRRRLAGVAAGVVLVGWFTIGAGFKYDAALCDAHNIRRASDYLWQFRADLQALRPELPDSARCYFWNIPSYIGFQLADGPAIRVWYENPTLTGHFLSEYVTDPSRPAFFFGHDDRGQLFEIHRGRPDPGLTNPPNLYVDAHADLGARLATAGEAEAAIIEWRKALEIHPNHPIVNANLGITLVEEQRYGEAIPVLERAVRLDPAYEVLELSLGLALAHLGRYAEARQHVDTFLTRAPDSPHRAQALEIKARLDAELSRDR